MEHLRVFASSGTKQFAVVHFGGVSVDVMSMDDISLGGSSSIVGDFGGGR